MSISGTDQDLLLCVAANELVLAQQAAGLLQITDQDATQRLEQLCAERLLTRVTLSGRLPPAYRITRTGAQQVDPHLPPLRALDMGRYRHEIGVAWLWGSARVGGLGNLRQGLSRREMQAADKTLRSESLIDTPGATFGDQPDPGSQPDPRHAYPDIALVQATGGWVSLDLVLTLPAPERLSAMVSRLHRHPGILAELYLVESTAGISEAVKAAAEQHAIAGRVHIQVLAEDGIAGVSITTPGIKQG
ncbi:MAG: hypothetical protein ACRDKL_07120 [Solirubrobacteraceae bacterium]